MKNLLTLLTLLLVTNLADAQTKKNSTTGKKISQDLKVADSIQTKKNVTSNAPSSRFNVDGDLAFTGNLLVGATPTAGTAGNVLISGGPNALPYWSNINLGATIDTLKINNYLSIGKYRLGLIGNTTLNNLALGDSLTFSSASLTGTNNLAIGFNTLTANTSGLQNLAVGHHALESNSSGFINSAIGHFSLYKNTIGYNNAAIGIYSMYNNISGFGNTGFGPSALFENETGNRNVGIGNLSLYKNKTGGYNVAIGANSMANNLNGSFNIAIGANQETGDQNSTYTSSYAMNIGGLLFGKNMTGSFNNPAGKLGIGKNNPDYTLDVNGDVAFSGNLLVGATPTAGTAGDVLFSGGPNASPYWSNINLGLTVDTLKIKKYLSIGRYRLGIIGYPTLDNLAFGDSLTFSSPYLTGNYNLAFGLKTLKSNTSGYDNLALGHSAMESNTSGYYNTAVGYSSLYQNTIGTLNAALGTFSLLRNTSGQANTGIGGFALLENETGNLNVGIGYGTLLKNKTGENNVALGANSLAKNINGSYNIAIGANQETGNQNVTYTSSYTMNIGGLLFGNNMTGSFNYPAGKLGIANNNPDYTLDVNGTINATSVRSNGSVVTSDARLKTKIRPLHNALAQISALRPVEYDKKNGLKDNNYNTHEYGFIAQEVKKVLPMLVTEGEDADKILALNYTALIPLLTNAIQEQQKSIQEQQDAMKWQQSTLQEVLQKMEKLQKEVEELKKK